MSETFADWMALLAIFAGGFALGGTIASLMWHRFAAEQRVYLNLAHAEIRMLRRTLGVTDVTMNVVDEDDEAAPTHQGSRQLQ